MRNLDYRKGFTLIELLVVVAIIGILASVVLASLNTARSKGSNAAIKSNLRTIKSQAEMVYDETAGNAYGTASNASSCTSPTAGSLFATTTAATTIVNRAVAAALAAGTGTGFCGSTTSAYVVSVQLKVAEGSFNYWCIDSAGYTGGRAAIATGTAC